MDPSTVPIIDSHIHIWPRDELDNISAMTADHPLRSEYLLGEYAAAAGTAAARLAGFVFVETDRKHDLSASPPDLSGPLLELAFLKRLHDGTGAKEEDATAGPPPTMSPSSCLAVVPWAPLPLGAAALEAFLRQAEAAAGPDVWAKVRGFRYLVQERPAGTMLGDGFVDGLKLLGRKGYLFELGVDIHRRGRSHLEEAVEMLARAHEGAPDEEKVCVVINHLCKPDLSILNPADPAFAAWRTAIYTLGSMPRTYMKLSGAFSEMPPSLAGRPADELVAALLPWLGVVLATFGPRRIMFGSDWPVCTVGGGADAWACWHEVVERMCSLGSLEAADVARVFAGTAREAYGIKEE